MFSILSRRCPLLATFLSVLFGLLSMLISDSPFDLVWFRLSCDHGWIRSGSVNVRKTTTTTHGIPPEFRGGGVLFLPAPHIIGSVPRLSGHAIAYRLRSLPRVRWHRVSIPQGSSSNGCCLCITMDQMLMCSSLFPHPLLVYREYVQIIGSKPVAPVAQRYLVTL